MIALYCRVSTQEQASEGYSIGEQQERLKNYCAAHDWKNFRVYVDGGYSGGSMNRPALQNMISDIKKGLIEKVVVYKLDRLSRSQKDSLVLIEDIFLKNSVDFISMSENFDTSSPFGRAMIGILSVFAQLEREQIKERMILGVEARAKSGKWCGSVPPIGYDYEDGQLQINDFEALQVREAFEMALNNKSVYNISDTFEKRGYKTKYGSWKPLRVRTALKNPIYTGQMIYSGNVYPGLHDPIISKDLFEDVQNKINKNHEQYLKFNRNLGKVNSYLGGLLICGDCGARYNKTTIKRKKNQKEYAKYLYYTCNSRNKKKKELIMDPNCKNKYWKMDELDNLVFNEIRKLATVPEYLDKKTNPSDEKNKKKALQEQIEKIDLQLSKVMDLYLLSDISFNIVEEKTKELNEQRQKIESQLVDLEESNSNHLDKKELLSILCDFDKTLKKGDFDEIRSVLVTLIEKIVINGEDIDIYWNF